MRNSQYHPQQKVNIFRGDLPLRGSEGHHQPYFGQGQERRSSPGHVGAYGKDRLHSCTFTLEISRSTISRVYHRISENFDNVFASSHCLILSATIKGVCYALQSVCKL